MAVILDNSGAAAPTSPIAASGGGLTSVASPPTAPDPGFAHPTGGTTIGSNTAGTPVFTIAGTPTATHSDVAVQKLYVGGATVFIAEGDGSPENAVVAPVGSLYLRGDGGVGTALYVKETGSSDTGWQAK